MVCFPGLLLVGLLGGAGTGTAVPEQAAPLVERAGAAGDAAPAKPNPVLAVLDKMMGWRAPLVFIPFGFFAAWLYATVEFLVVGAIVCLVFLAIDFGEGFFIGLIATGIATGVVAILAAISGVLALLISMATAFTLVPVLRDTLAE
jgi:hypothetical protein